MSDSIKTPVNFTFNIGVQDNAGDEIAVTQEGKSFCMALLGDFTGRKNKHAADTIEQRLFKLIDSYDYDDVLASFNIQLELAMGDEGAAIQVPIKKFKDFHPDQLFKNVNVFSTLRDLRQRLQNTSTFDAAANEIQGWLVPADEPEIKVAEVVEEKPEESIADITPAIKEEISTDNLLDSILEATDMQSANIDTPARASNSQLGTKESLVDNFVQQLMSNRVKVSLNPRKDEMLAAVDDSISELMRAILHHADFQAVESSWQAIRFMVRRIKSGKNIKLFLLDVTRDELDKDLSTDDVAQSALYKLFCDAEYGDIDWNLIVGNYQFGADINDILLLSQLGFVAKQAAATFISAADEKLIGCESFAKTPGVNRWDYDVEKNVAEAWVLLRQSDVAKHLSLALPSFLIREPYSSITNPIKSFSFEEVQLPIQHDDYLWANAAFLKAEQFARAFAKQGWNMQLGDVANTEDLPMHSYEDKGKTVVKPCAEIPLTDTGAIQIQQQGIIPLWSIKNTDKIHSGEFFTLSSH